jgi:ferredoxin
VPECPVDAIVADTDIEPDDPWLHLNAELAKLPSFVEITEIDESKRPADAAEWKDVPNKLELLDKG